MNKNIRSLYFISQQQSRRILGLMSGTSLDGLDIAVCTISGSGLDTQVVVENFETFPYTDEFRATLLEIISRETINLKRLTELNADIGRLHAVMIKKFLKKWHYQFTDIDLIASHGQTVFHAPDFGNSGLPARHATLQIGDGDHIAVQTGIITISDFRQKHVAAGGQGAPLAGYADFLLFAERTSDVFLLNIGGIANLTYIPAGEKFSEVVCYDTGPGNTLMDKFIHWKFPALFYDDAGTMAARGIVNEKLLATLMSNEYFRMKAPKTTGPEMFNLEYIQSKLTKNDLENESPDNILATLNKFTAETISTEIGKQADSNKEKTLFVSGGGARNQTLLSHLIGRLPDISFRSLLAKGINPDAKEAVLFAVLANESICGDPRVFGSGEKERPAISFGKISFPV